MELKIIMPTSWKDITLKDYQEFLKINKEEDEIFVRQKMVQIFCQVPLIAVNSMNRKDFYSISNSIINIMQEKPKLQPRTTIKGVEYGFIPNLDKDLSIGEFTDLDTYMKDWDNFHKAMAVLYRPITTKSKDKYLIEAYEGSDKYAEAMKGMSMDVVMGSVVFFWTLSRQLLLITPKYLQRQIAKDKNLVKALEQNGVGINIFTQSLEGTVLGLERLLNLTYTRHFYS